MKQPKKPTLANKKLMIQNGLNPDEWMVHFEDDLYLHVIPKGAKSTSDARILDKK